MKNKVAISKIQININGKEIELSLEEAQELRQILDETFGKPERVFYPPSPIIIERPRIQPWHWWEGPIFTCDTVTISSKDTASLWTGTSGMFVPGADVTPTT